MSSNLTPSAKHLGKLMMLNFLEKTLNFLFNPNVLAIVKTFTYKIISGTTTFAIVYLWEGPLSGDLKGAASAVTVMMVIHMFQYWIHERLWLAWENYRTKQKIAAQ